MAGDEKIWFLIFLTTRTSIEEEVEKLCSRLPPIMQEPCDEFVSGKKKRNFSWKFHLSIVWAPIIIPLLEQKETADAVCLAINFCGGGEPGPVCRLLNPPNDLVREQAVIASTRKMIASRQQMSLKKKNDKKSSPPSARDTPWGWLLKRLEYTFNSHLPFDDFDNDTFSTVREFRGWSWRGRDCNDFDRNVRPGRDSKGLDPTVDWNCNGIYGVNPETGKGYEEELCSGTPQYGIAYVGDSAGAHFHIPPSFMNASQIQANTFQDLVQILANEFDWPSMVRREEKKKKVSFFKAFSVSSQQKLVMRTRRGREPLLALRLENTPCINTIWSETVARSKTTRTFV